MNNLKRRAILFLVLLFALTAVLSACGGTNGKTEPDKPEPTGEPARQTKQTEQPAPSQQPEQKPETEPSAATADPAQQEQNTQELQPAAQEAERDLTAEELGAINESLSWSDNGFFITTYDRPEEIDWHEVMYNGAGIKVDLTEEQLETFAHGEELMTDVTAIPGDALRAFVLDRTGIDYKLARKPLDRWEYLGQWDLYAHQHGDTNMQPVTITSGQVQGNTYRLHYIRDDWEHYVTDREFIMTAVIEDGHWRYLSNLPADSPAPITLAEIRYFATREEAEAFGGVISFTEVPYSADDYTEDLCWAVVTARQDNVRYIVDRLGDRSMYALCGLRMPGEYVTSGVMNDGESIALYVSREWMTADVSVSLYKDSYWGEYYIDQEYWLDLPLNEGRYITGHDLQGEGRGAYPKTEQELVAFLSDGPWAFCDKEGNVTAAIVFDNYRNMSIMNYQCAYPIMMEYDRLENTDDQPPDLVKLEKGWQFESDWENLPDWFPADSLGDYVISSAQVDNMQLLYLDQANNGDGALSYILPGAGENDHSFVLLRYRGIAEMENQGG